MSEKNPEVLVSATMTFPQWVQLKDWINKQTTDFPEQIKAIEKELLKTLFIPKEKLTYKQ